MRARAAAGAVAISVLAAAVLLRWLLDPLMGDTLPLVTLFGAVAAAVWVGGQRLAGAIAALGYVACFFLFIEPRGPLGLDRTDNLVGLGAYAFTCALIIGFGEALRRAQQRSSEHGDLLRVTLGSIGDAVITTDTAGRVTYLNAVAQELTGWTNPDARGKPLEAVFRIVHEDDGRPAESPAARALREGLVVGLANHTVLIARDGTERPIDDSAAPIRDERGHVSGCVLVFRDISARRESEKQGAGHLVDARVLASIVESSDDAIISKNLDGTILSWNAAAERLFGYTPEQAIGRHVSLIIPPERIAEEADIIASLREGRRVDHYETERRHRDGHLLLVSLTISPIRDADGNVVGASKIARDITRPRQAEERERALLAEAAAANAKFRAFFDQGALFAGILDVDGTVLERNHLSLETSGFAREEVVGKPLWEVPAWRSLPEVAERIRAAFAAAVAGEIFRAELPYHTSDGGERVIDAILQPIKADTGRVLFVALIGIDVTDRRQAEEERQKFVTLVENSTDFIGICDRAGVPFYINRAGLQLVGLDSVEDARRTHVRDFFLPEDQARILDEFFPSVLANGHGETEVRFRNFKTGATRWMAYKVLLLLDDAGQPMAFATVSQDVTQRRELEDDLRTLASDLSDADRRKDEFLATLAHELRNPLAPLSNLLVVLKHLGRDAAEFQHTVDTMERQLAQMVRLVDDLLDVNRITHNRLELRRSRVELGVLIAQAVDTARPLAEAAGHELCVVAPPEPVQLDADPVRLSQVFGNLLNNACRYTRPGGRITVTTERSASEVAVTVADTGTGIPPDQLERIFEMFTQVDRSLERSQGGLGIGLTLVKSLVQMHGGSVEARSAGVGQGSEFTVRLPVAEASGAAHSPAPAAAPASLAPRRILVVDDNRDAASSLGLLLELTGNQIHIAHDGAEALAAAEQHHPEVVLLDLGLPTLNGYEVCQRIRKQPWGCSMLIVALTGWGQEEDRDRSRAAGFDSHLVKPVDYHALLALLSTHPEGRAED